jgi:plasmid stability protein
MPQYTIRNIPDSVDRELRARARKSGKSLNEAAIEALKRGVGVAGNVVVYDDLDDLAGTWQQDKEFDAAIRDQDTVDRDAWR